MRPPVWIRVLGGVILLAASPPSPGDVVTVLQERLDGLVDLRAKFTQIYHSETLGPVPTEEGTVYVKMPGRMRWEYSHPAGKLAILDGEKTYLYLPEEKQVFVGDWQDLQEEGPAALLLTGKLRIAGEFFVEQVPGSPDIPPGMVRLRLIPRRPDTHFDAFLMDLDRGGTRIRGVQMEDPLGNRVEYRFRNIRENLGLSEDLFRFEPPQDSGIQWMENHPGVSPKPP